MAGDLAVWPVRPYLCFPPANAWSNTRIEAPALLAVLPVAVLVV